MKMLKSLTFFTALVFIASSLMAQVSEGLQPFAKKESGNALTISVEGQVKNVAAVLDKKFKTETNSKGKAIRGVKTLTGGMKTFQGVRYSTISSSTMDYTYRVEKTRGAKDQAVVHLWISTGNNNFIDSDSYSEEMSYATEVLEGLQYEITVYEFELMIQEQEKVASIEMKNYDKMVKDSIKLQDQLAKLLEDIEENKMGRADQLNLIAAEEQKLADFRLEFEDLKGIPRQEEVNMDELARSADNKVEEVKEAKEEKKSRFKKKNDEPEEDLEEMMEEEVEESPRAVQRSQTLFDVMLIDAGDSKFNVIKEIKSVTGLGMGASKKIVDGSKDGPVAVMKGVSADEAEVIKEILEEAGAKVELK